MKEVSFSIIIPNWNGENLLKKNLPKVIKAASEAEILVVDDASSDKSVSLIKSEFPQVKLIIHKKNKGFGESCNDGVKIAEGKIIILLNTDVIPINGFLEPLKKDFLDNKIFAVGLGEISTGPGLAVFKNGAMELIKTERLKKSCPAFWVSGGQSAFSKDKWLEIGGFDHLYRPFYFEDIDLCYRAWKRGYKIIWDPDSIVKHEHIGVIKSSFTESYITFVSERNHLLFIWKNIYDRKMLLKNFVWILKRLVCSPGYWKPFLAAKKKLPWILLRKIKELKEQKVSDKEIFEMFVKSNKV